MNDCNSFTNPVARRFCYREDIGCYLKLPLQTKVSHKFSSSFDAEVEEGLLHFTANESAMAPLSLLVPAEVIAEAITGWPIVVQKSRLVLGQYEFTAAPSMSPVQPGEEQSRELLQANLAQLYRNIKLFGRQSPVLTMITANDKESHILSTAAAMISAGERNLLQFVSYLGIGEGLTPAFDDFLAGMLFVDRFYRYNRLIVPEEFWQKAATRTTRQAVQQYKYAFAGRFSRQFELFVADLPQRQVSSAEITRLLAWGHSSGTDILCGIWNYLSQQVKMN